MLDHDVIRARAAAEKSAFEAMLSGEREPLTPRTTRADVERQAQTIGELQIRRDCDLIAAWEAAHHEPAGPFPREQILKFVLNRRGVNWWPDWAGRWVAGGTDA